MSVHFFDPLHLPSSNLKNNYINFVEDYFNFGSCVFVCKNQKNVYIGSYDKAKQLGVYEIIGRVVSLMTVIFPLLMLISKCIIRCSHSFEVLKPITPQKPLEIKQVKELSREELIETSSGQIKSLFESVLKQIPAKGLRLYHKFNNNRIFEVDQVPGWVFKMKVVDNSINERNPVSERFKNNLLGRKICEDLKLDLLKIPENHFFTIKIGEKHYDVLAEKKVDFDDIQEVQEHHFMGDERAMDEALRQLAVFICHTGYSDLDWPNVPVLKSNKDGNLQIGLIDLEDMNSVYTGLFGDEKYPGIVERISQRQAEIVKKVALENGIDIGGFTQAVEKGRSYLKMQEQLRKFYSDKKIYTGREIIKYQPKPGDFYFSDPLNERLRACASNIIVDLNKKISSQNCGGIKSHRTVKLQTQGDPSSKYNDLDRTYFEGDDFRIVENKPENQPSFFHIVLDKLKEKSVIFDYEIRWNHYIIHA